MARNVRQVPAKFFEGHFNPEDTLSLRQEEINLLAEHAEVIKGDYFVSSLLALPAFQELESHEDQEAQTTPDNDITAPDMAQLVEYLMKLPAFGELGPLEDFSGKDKGLAEGIIPLI